MCEYNLNMEWELIGHDWAVDILARHLSTNQVRHAYLITGPDGVGKRTLAQRFAQALNCEEPPLPGRYCGKCRACQLIAGWKHPDLHLVESEGKGLAVKIESIRELQRKLALAPFEGRWRIAVLLRFQEATLSSTSSAANAMLKTLEEPPDRVVIILTAREAEALPPTVVSRCETIPLRAVPRSELEAALVGRGVDEEHARLLSSISAGRPGVALALAGDDEQLKQRTDDLNDLAEVISMNKSARIQYAEHFKPMPQKMDDWQVKRGRAIDLLETWQKMWRDAMLLSLAAEASLGNPDRRDIAETMAGRLSVMQIAACIDRIQAGIDAIHQNANLQLTMESVLLEMPRIRLRTKA
jgi:DNA polymerase-3 subunit delta'